VADGVAGWAPADEVVRFDQAIDHFTREIQAHLDSADPYRRRGVIRSQQGQNDLALADYTDAIRLNPRDDRVLNNRALSCRTSRSGKRGQPGPEALSGRLLLAVGAKSVPVRRYGPS